jgi:glycosyltransferase involved in cell wall biosynthesis
MILNTVPEGILGSPIPQVTIVHDLLPLIYPPEYPRQQYYFRFLVRRILQESRIVVADSDNTRRDIIQNYGLPAEKVRVIHPGYDSSVYFRNGFDPSAAPHAEPYFLYVGNLLPHKNLLRLLDALAILRRRQPCRLIIRGEGRPAYVRALRERVETLGLSDVVTFLGYTTEASLRDLYSRAVCLVLPSLGEGFGLPVLEAMACGTPVVTSNASSLPEVAGDAALLVDPHDAVALVDAVHRVLTDRGLREDLRRRGFERATLFTWRRAAERISRVLEEAAGGKLCP